MALQDRWCNIQEAADLLGCTKGRVCQLIDDGTLAAEKCGKYPNSPYLVDRKSVAKFAKVEITTGRPRKGAPAA